MADSGFLVDLRAYVRPLIIVLLSCSVLVTTELPSKGLPYDVIGGPGKMDWDSDLDGAADGWFPRVYGLVQSDFRLVAGGVTGVGKYQTVTAKSSYVQSGSVGVLTIIDAGRGYIVDQGDTVHVSAYLRSSLSPGTVVTARVRCADAQWNTLAQEPFISMSSSEYQWREHTGTAVVVPGTAHVVVEFFVQPKAGWGVGKLSIDNVSVDTEVSAIPAPVAGAVPACIFDRPGGDVVYAARRFQVCEFHEHQAALMRTFKQYNPDSIVLLYEVVAAASDADWATDYPNDPIGYAWIAAHHPEWFLLDVNGQLARIPDYPYLVAVDLGDPLFQRVWAANAIRLAKTLGADGIKLDGLSARYWDANVTLAKYPDTASYVAAANSFARYVIPEIRRAGLLAVANGSSEDWDTAPWSDWLQLMDGREYERAAPYYQTVNEWRTLLNGFRRSPDKIYIQYLTNPAIDEQFFRFEFASFLIWSTTRAYVGLHGTGPELPYHPLLDAPLGQPVADGEQIGATAYHRSYQNGEVFLEVSADQTETVYIPDGLKDAVTGDPVPPGAYALAPHQALILLRR